MDTDEHWFPTLPKAPIVEALLDVWVANPPSVTAERLKDLHKEYEQEYPNVDNLPFPFPHVQLTGVPGAPNTGGTSLGLRGFRFSAANGETMVQSRIDGFTFNNVGRYKNWEFFSTRAIEAW